MNAAASSASQAGRRRQIKTALALAVVVLTGSLGSVTLRAGLRHEAISASLSPAALLADGARLLSNSYLWLGTLLRAVSGIAFMCLLSWADYSYVNPASSSAYIVTVFLGWLVLGEVVPFARWLGTLLICLGVVLVGMTPPSTARASFRKRSASPPANA